MEISFDTIMWLAVCWGCALIFDGIALYSYRKKTPMHFWAGSTVRSEEVTDVTAYNKANAVMWLVYSLTMWIGGAVGVFDMKLGGMILGVSCTLGILVLIFWYMGIKRKYFRE